MDVQDSTAGRNRLDHDPAASSMPPIPLPDSADVPDVVLQRHDETAEQIIDATPVSDRPAVRQLWAKIERALDNEHDRGARDALLRVLRALDQDLVPEIIGTLRPLTYHGADYADAVLRSLDALVEGGEAS